MAEVVVYTKSWCPYCWRAKRLLERKSIAYGEVDVTQDADLEAEMVRRAGGRRRVPQVFIGDLHVGGSDELGALDARGELDRLVGTPVPSS